MANRYFNQFSFGLEKNPVRLYAKVAIGAAGAPTLSVPNSKGIKSIVRNSAGDYTMTLQDPYNKLLALESRVQNATGIPTSSALGIKALAVSNVAAPTIEFVYSAAGTAADPASGDTLYIEIVLSNSTAA